jgi:hypothetical protein
LESREEATCDLLLAAFMRSSYAGSASTRDLAQIELFIGMAIEQRKALPKKGRREPFIH